MKTNLGKTQGYRMYLGECPYCGKRLHLEQEINLMEPNTIGESEDNSSSQSIKGDDKK